MDEELFSWHQLETSDFLVVFGEKGIVPPKTEVVVQNTGGKSANVQIRSSASIESTDVRVDSLTKKQCSLRPMTSRPSIPSTKYRR